jgi:hypothetical protein
VTLETADRVALGLAALALVSDVDRSLWVVADLGQSDHVDRVVELSVPAAVEPVLVGASGADRYWSASGDPGEFGV